MDFFKRLVLINSFNRLNNSFILACIVNKSCSCFKVLDLSCILLLTCV